MKNTVLLFLFIITLSKSYCQDHLNYQAPTLQVGLDGFSFVKGSLDAQLIMEIIAEKQQDLKVKAIQNTFLKKVENAGGTIYNFVDNVVRQLVFEPDQNVRTKKIMENVVNIVFAEAFLKFYKSVKADSTLLRNLESNYFIYNKLKDLKDYEKNPEINKELYDDLNAYQSVGKSNASNEDSMQMVNNPTFGFAKYSKPQYTAENNSKGIAFIYDEYKLSYEVLLLDLATEVIRENTKLKELGLMQIAYSESYDYLNKYKLLQEENDTSVIFSLEKELKKDKQINEITLNIDTMRKATLTLADSLKKEMQNSLTTITNFIGLISFYNESHNFHRTTITAPNANKPGTTKFNYNAEIDNLIGNVKGTISTMIKTTASKDSAYIHDLNLLTDFYLYLDKVNRVFDSIPASPIQSEILYTIHADFLPNIKNMVHRDDTILNLLEEINDFNTHVADSLVKLLNVNDIWEERYIKFRNIISTLYEFDKASTISEYLNLLEGITEYIENDDIKDALSSVVSFVKDYTVVENNADGKEVLSFNLESYLYRLQSVKPYEFKRTQLLFTVGMNNSGFYNDIMLSDTSIVRNLSYVGEKIGLKILIVDRSFWMTRNPGETYLIGNSKYTKVNAPYEPILSNVHYIIYGSGILYNLVNSKTNKEFKLPLLGTGFGLTFYNGLDMNLSVGIPLQSSTHLLNNFQYWYWNFGFDIQFIEYYNRLNEKRKSNQIQKKYSRAMTSF